MAKSKVGERRREWQDVLEAARIYSAAWDKFQTEHPEVDETVLALAEAGLEGCVRAWAELDRKVG